jgi:hypothetical protein
LAVVMKNALQLKRFYVWALCNPFCRQLHRLIWLILAKTDIFICFFMTRLASFR